MTAALLYLAVVAVAIWLFWRWMEECLQRATGQGAQDEVSRLRRGWVEKRLGMDRRDPDRRGSPPPLTERRSGRDRRNSARF